MSDLADQAMCLLTVLTITQFIVSRQLVLFFFKVPIRIIIPLEIIKFLVLTGPAATLLTNIGAYYVLDYYSALPTETLLYICATKWVGELLSIVFLTPIFLFLHPNIYVKQARRATAAIITSLLCFIIICFVYSASNSNFNRDKKQEFVNGTVPFVEKISSTQSTIKLYLKAIEAYFQSSEKVTREEFNAFSSIIQNTSIKVRAIGWVPFVDNTERLDFELDLQREQFANGRIRQFTSTGFIDAPSQPYYLPIYYSYPLEGNRSAIGLDVSTHPIAGRSIDKAILTSDFVITNILTLVQEQDKADGVVVYYPVFEKGKEKRLASLIGLVEVVLELNKLLGPLYTYNEGMFTYQISYGEGNQFSHPNYEAEHFVYHDVEFNLFDKKGMIKFSSSDLFAFDLINWRDFAIVFVGCVLGVVCVMFVFFIVSFNAYLEKKVKQGTQELTEKNNQLTLANEAKNLFLANVSHEYRTPLNAIIGFTEIAKNETSDKVALNYLKQISDASNILLSTVNDVLDFSKMQAGQLDLDIKPFKPSEVTASVIGMLQYLAEEKSIKIHLNYEQSYDNWVEGDELRFKQILINLLNNALKFTAKGSVTIDCRSVQDSAGYSILTIKVIDTGIGIKQADQTRLFTSFAQAQSSTTRKYGGTGLGLSIVKQLCILMDGGVSVESEEGVGSKFIVTLKLKGSTHNDKKHLSLGKSVELEQTHSFMGTKVLVVEDNKINQIVVEKHLRNLGVDCDFANDGQQALEYLKVQQPDLILMDLQMPVMDGFTATEHIKNDENLKHISIVILSASVGKEEKQQAMLLGVEDFIHKPYKQSDLERVLIKYVY